MMKKILKNLCLGVAMSLGLHGFAQQPEITLLDIEQVGTVSEGAMATFRITYRTDGSGPDLNSTSRLYLTGSGAVSAGFSPTAFPQTNGANSTIDLSYLWPSGFASDANYDYRFFQPSGGADFDWDPIFTNHYPGGAVNSGGPAGAPYENTTGWLGLIFEVTVQTLSADDFSKDKLSIYLSNNELNISAADAADYKIYSVTGAEVRSGLAATKIDVSALTSGLYIYKSENGFAKFVK